MVELTSLVALQLREVDCLGRYSGRRVHRDSRWDWVLHGKIKLDNCTELKEQSERSKIYSIIAVSCFNPILVCFEKCDENCSLVFLLPGDEERQNSPWEHLAPALVNQKMVRKLKTRKKISREVWFSGLKNLQGLILC